jgi:hypothetical protein
MSRNPAPGAVRQHGAPVGTVATWAVASHRLAARGTQALMSETVESGRAGTGAPEDLTAQYASLRASEERVLLVRQRHWLTFLEAGRWFVGSVAIGIVLLALAQPVPDDGLAGPLSTLLNWGFGCSSRSG